jgi:hypothetical protein
MLAYVKPGPSMLVLVCFHHNNFQIVNKVNTLNVQLLNLLNDNLITDLLSVEYFQLCNSILSSLLIILPS